MRIALVALALIAAAALQAAACPPGPCLKYRHRVPVERQVQVYRRAARAVPPRRFDRPSLGTFLTQSAWLPIAESAQDASRSIAPRTLRFAKPSRITNAATATADRVALIRQLERRNGRVFVEIDGVFYTLDRCADESRRATSCLTYEGALPAEDPPVTEHRFAAPP